MLIKTLLNRIEKVKSFFYGLTGWKRLTERKLSSHPKEFKLGGEYALLHFQQIAHTQQAAQEI